MSDQEEPTFVRITNQMVWNKLLEIERALNKLTDNPKRIRSLELKFYGVLAGLLAALVTVVALVQG